MEVLQQRGQAAPGFRRQVIQGAVILLPGDTVQMEHADSSGKQVQRLLQVESEADDMPHIHAYRQAELQDDRGKPQWRLTSYTYREV